MNRDLFESGLVVAGVKGRCPMIELEQMVSLTAGSLSGLSDRTIFGLVAAGKKEAFFRDLVARQIAREYPDAVTKPEWDIPSEAAVRWESRGLTRAKTKGIVDLAVLSEDNLFTEQPPTLMEFKLWYSADCCLDTKYEPRARPNHSIEKAAMIDADKIRAVRNGEVADDYIVTVVNTVHADEVDVRTGRRLVEELHDKGVQYAALHAQKRFVSMTSREVREQGLARASAVLSSHVRSLSLVECGKRSWNGISVSVDVLVGLV